MMTKAVLCGKMQVMTSTHVRNTFLKISVQFLKKTGILNKTGIQYNYFDVTDVTHNNDDNYLTAF